MSKILNTLVFSLKLQMPPAAQTLEEADLSSMARSFYVSRRKVGSKVIGPELGITLRYPDYESGLAAVLQAEQGDHASPR